MSSHGPAMADARNSCVMLPWFARHCSDLGPRVTLPLPQAVDRPAPGIRAELTRGALGLHFALQRLAS